MGWTQRPIPGLLPLLLYVLLRGLDATVLKGLQDLGQANPVQGENPISFCNVFFLSQLTVALAALLPGRRSLIGDRPDWRRLTGACWPSTAAWACSSGPWPTTSPWSPCR